MQSRNRFLDDVSQLMTNAAGVAQGMKEEAETAIRARLERGDLHGATRSTLKQLAAWLERRA